MDLAAPDRQRRSVERNGGAEALTQFVDHERGGGFRRHHCLAFLANILTVVRAALFFRFRFAEHRRLEPDFRCLGREDVVEVVGIDDLGIEDVAAVLHLLPGPLFA